MNYLAFQSSASRRRCVAALSALLVSVPCAASDDGDLISAETLSLTANFRLSATDGEESWVDGGFGKLANSGNAHDGDFRILPQFGDINLIWQPRFGWALSATVVAALQGGERTEWGIEQAFLSFKPLRASKHRLTARAGLLWPAISLEHEGADWHVADTITPSAINSWVGEEVRPLALEVSGATNAREHELSATAGIFVANDTSGTLLSFRGWALHPRTTLAFRRQPLPPLPAAIGTRQPPFTHPLLDVGPGFAKRPGYYLKLAWQPPVALRVELFRYDNRADPEAVNHDKEWGWRTQFNQVAAIADLGGGTRLKAQAMAGRTRMGMTRATGIWVDTDFRSAFVLATHAFASGGVAARVEGFDMRQNGSLVAEESDETGWAATLAGHRDWGPVTGVVELLHVSSRRPIRATLGEDPRQNQTTAQAEVRLRW